MPVNNATYSSLAKEVTTATGSKFSANAFLSELLLYKKKFLISCDGY
jgi:hypothetical protein